MKVKTNEMVKIRLTDRKLSLKNSIFDKKMTQINASTLRDIPNDHIGKTSLAT